MSLAGMCLKFYDDQMKKEETYASETKFKIVKVDYIQQMSNQNEEKIGQVTE